MAKKINMIEECPRVIKTLTLDDLRILESNLQNFSHMDDASCDNPYIQIYSNGTMEVCGDFSFYHSDEINNV